MNKIICTIGHLGVDTGEVGILLETGEDVRVKWNNGMVEHLQYDFIEFLTARNKKAYIVSFDFYERLFLKKKDAVDFKRDHKLMGYSVGLKTLDI